MKFDQLYYFAEAIKHHSISVAARKNFVPQSTVSTAITKLEKELGTSLLKRSNKGVTPTEMGLFVLDKSKQIFSIMEDIRLETNPSENHLSLNISAMPALVDTILADLILEVDQTEQPLHIDIISDEPTGILQSVQLGLVDLGIIFDNHPFQSSKEYPDMIYQPLFTDSYYLFVGRHSPYYNYTSISIGEALQCPHIAYKTEFENKENVLTKIVSPYGLPKVALRVDNTESMRRLISKSKYVAFFPYFTIYHDPYIDYEWIRAIPINNADFKIYIGYVESTLFKDFQGNQIFKKILKEVFSKYYPRLLS